MALQKFGGEYLAFDGDLQAFGYDDSDAGPYPNVDVQSPVNDGAVGGIYTFVADVTDPDDQADSVQLKIDGVLVGSPVLSEPWEVDYDVSALSGEHDFSFLLTYDGGSSKESDPVTALVDNVDPSGGITFPADNSYVSGTIIATTNAADNDEIESVQWQIDSHDFGPVMTEADAPYSKSIDTTEFDPGAHVLGLVITDRAGNETTDSHNVTFDNANPEVEMSAPNDGDTVTDLFLVSADASDDVGIASVQFFSGATPVSDPITSPPYETSISLSNGDHQLSARAIDLAGNVTDSDEITVTAENSPNPPPVFTDDKQILTELKLYGRGMRLGNFDIALACATKESDVTSLVFSLGNHITDVRRVIVLSGSTAVEVQFSVDNDRNITLHDLTSFTFCVVLLFGYVGV